LSKLCKLFEFTAAAAAAAAWSSEKGNFSAQSSHQRVDSSVTIHPNPALFMAAHKSVGLRTYTANHEFLLLQNQELAASSDIKCIYSLDL
jgi:hypothetical protein